MTASGDVPSSGDVTSNADGTHCWIQQQIAAEAYAKLRCPAGCIALELSACGVNLGLETVLPISNLVHGHKDLLHCLLQALVLLLYIQCFLGVDTVHSLLPCICADG